MEVVKQSTVDKEHLILETAKNLMAQFGVKKTTVDDIAREAGIAKGTIYLYFKTKNDIIETVVRKEANFIMSSLKQAIDEKETACEKLREYLLTRFSYHDSFYKQYETYALQVKEALMIPQIKAIQEQYYQVDQNIMKEILSFGMNSGEFYIEDLELISKVLMQAIHGVEINWKEESEEISLEKRVDIFLRLITKGISNT